MSRSPSDRTTVYVYSAGQAGIPGLPQRLTRVEAEAQGLLEALESAIAAGAYLAESDPQNQPVIRGKKESDHAD